MDETTFVNSRSNRTDAVKNEPAVELDESNGKPITIGYRSAQKVLLSSRYAMLTFCRKDFRKYDAARCD